jgi:hypothetical protein
VESDGIEPPHRRRRAFLPFALTALISMVAFVGIIQVSPPANAGDWGSLLSALVALVALGAFTSTIFLQTEELALQRKEISNLAVSAREQGDSMRRQTIIESYRVIDDKIDALFRDEEFDHILKSSEKPSNLKYMLGEIKESKEKFARADLRGIQNIRSYKFVTQHHCFPVSIYRSDNYGGVQDVKCLLPIMRFCILSLVGSSGPLGHVYELAKSLDLLDYARFAIGRRTILEAPLFAASYFERKTLEPFDRPIYLAPGVALSEIEDTVRYHLENELKFYNPLTASLAGEALDEDVDILSPMAEEPFGRR